MQGAISASYLPGNQVDGLPGIAVIPKLSRLPKGKSDQRLSVMILTQRAQLCWKSNTKAIWAAQGKKWPATIGNFRSKFDQFESVSVDYMLVYPLKAKRYIKNDA